MTDTIREFEFLSLVDEAIAEVAIDTDKVETCEEVRRIVTKKLLDRIKPPLTDTIQEAGKAASLHPSDSSPAQNNSTIIK